MKDKNNNSKYYYKYLENSFLQKRKCARLRLQPINNEIKIGKLLNYKSNLKVFQF